MERKEEITGLIESIIGPNPFELMAEIKLASSAIKALVALLSQKGVFSPEEFREMVKEIQELEKQKEGG